MLRSDRIADKELAEITAAVSDVEEQMRSDLLIDADNLLPSTKASPRTPARPWLGAKYFNVRARFAAKEKPMKRLAASLILCTVASGLAAADSKSGAAKPFAPVNVTGTWEAQNEGFRARLRQDGDVVSGENAKATLAVRGGWSGSDLVLVVNWAPGNAAKCERSTLVVSSNGTVQRLPSMWFSKDGTRKDTLSRVSAEAGGAGGYPYAAELTACGDLTAYELAFDSGKDALRGASWPILDAVAGLLKADRNLKLRVVGHSDSTGDAAANKALSQRRAEGVRQKLVERAAVDANRVAATGLGAEQPLQDNASSAGRAANRRVEIAVVR